MADRIVNVKVTTTGLKEGVAEAEKFNNALDRAAKPRKSTVGAASAAFSASETNTGLTRGTAAAANRGDARDFGRQAQGLGGLVHLYATFAANVFAVSAAFNALSKAADFTNMQKAADILSTKVGSSINSLAKDMKNLTDGAISMSDALSSASLGATAGLTSKQIKELTTVAKGASIALGRDMTDALQRVFRGTIKIEPELLDELGLMVKVNDANKNYAKTLNKTVTSLTDYERRQAFVNEVTKQGISKYQELANQTVNPYSKLISSIRDLGTATLSVINGALSPFINLLSSSPTALLLGMTALVTLLLKQAVPALSQLGESWKANKQAAIESNLAELKSIRDLRDAKVQSSIDINNASKSLIAVESEIAKLSNKKMPGGQDLSKTFASIAFDPETIEADKKKAIEAIEKARKEINDKIAKYEQPRKGLSLVSDAESEKISKVVDQQKAHLETLSKLQNTVNTLSSGITANALQKESLSATAEKLKSLESLETQYKTTVQRSIATRNVVEKTEQLGFRAGISQLFHELNTGTSDFDEHGKAVQGTARQYSILEKASIGVRGTFSLLSVGLSKLLGGFSVLMGSAMLATIALKALGEWTGVFTDASDKLIESQDKVSESLNTYFNIQEKLKTSGSLTEMYISQGAAAQAYAESLDNIATSQQKLEKFKKEATGTDVANEEFKQAFGSGILAQDTYKAEIKLFNERLATDTKFKEKYGLLFGKSSFQKPNIAGGRTVEEALSFTGQSAEQSIANIEKLQAALADDSASITEYAKANKALAAELKDLDTISSTYSTSLQDQSVHLKALNIVSSSTNKLFNQLATSIEDPTKQITSISTFLSGITDQFQDMTHIKLPDSLSNLKTELFSIQQVAELAYQNSIKLAQGDNKQIESAKQTRTDEIKNNSIALLKNYGLELMTFSIKSTKALADLAVSAASASIAQAGLAKSLRLTKFLAGLSPDTTTERVSSAEFKTERSRVAIENSITAKNTEIIKEELNRNILDLARYLGSSSSSYNELEKLAQEKMERNLSPGKDASSAYSKNAEIISKMASVQNTRAKLFNSGAQAKLNSLALPTQLEEDITNLFNKAKDSTAREDNTTDMILSKKTTDLSSKFSRLTGVGSEVVDSLYAYNLALISNEADLSKAKSSKVEQESRLNILDIKLKAAKPDSKVATDLTEAIVETKKKVSIAEDKVSATEQAKITLEYQHSLEAQLRIMKDKNNLSIKGLELSQLDGKLSGEDLSIRQIELALAEDIFKLKEANKLVSNNMLATDIAYKKSVAEANIKIQERTKELRIQQEIMTDIESILTSNKPSTGLLNADQLIAINKAYTEILAKQKEIDQSKIANLTGSEKIVAQEALRVKYLEKQLQLEEQMLEAKEKATAPYEIDKDLMAQRFKVDARKFRDTLDSYNKTVVSASYKAVDTFVDGITNAVKNLDFNLKNIIRDTVFAFDDMMMEYAGNQLKAIMKDAISGMFGVDMRTQAEKDSQATLIENKTSNDWLSKIYSAIVGKTTNPIGLIESFKPSMQDKMLSSQTTGFTPEELFAWGGTQADIISAQNAEFDSISASANILDNSTKSFGDHIKDFGRSTLDFIKGLFNSLSTSSSSIGSSTSSGLSSLFSGLFGGTSSASMFASQEAGFSAADLAAWGGSMTGFATGGSFKVGGQGATDSKLVQFMASPGEEVAIKTPAQQKDSRGSNMHVTNNFTITGGTTSRESQQQISAKVGLAIQRSLARNN